MYVHNLQLQPGNLATAWLLYLQKVDVLNGVVPHDLTDSGDRADVVLGTLEETQISHHLSLKVLFLLHVTGGVAWHGGEVAKLQLPYL